MKVKNYESVKEEIRSKLLDYLKSKGFTNLQNFHCINPSHKDKSPSCGVLKDKTHFHCLGCGITGDIFHACHFLEGKPITGSAFLVDNLSYLAKQFGIQIEVGEMTDSEIYELDTYRAYDLASKVLTSQLGSLQFQSNGASLVHEEIERRGWTKEVLEKTRVGANCNSSDMLHQLKLAGFSEEFLTEIGLTRSDIFSNTSLVFTITDHHGRVVGFAARDCTWNPSSSSPKYTNNSTGKANIYQKGRRLFHLDRALSTVKAGAPLYIMEGYGDVITAVQNGIENSCAIGGTALTEDHILLLRELGISNIILCLDGDKAGQDTIEKLLDTRFANAPDINIKIVIIPDDKDPDDFIRESGIEAFRKLVQWSAFEWRLLRFPEGTDSEEVSKLMIPLIVSEPSFITQEKMVEALSNHTGISQKTIQAEVLRLQDDKERRIARERSVLIDLLTRNLKTSPTDAEIFLREGLTNLLELNKKYDQNKLGPESCLKLLEDQKFIEESKTGEFAGFRLGSALEPLEDALAGEWKKDVLMCFGGKANSGKTSLLAKLAVEIASHPENNACVIFHTIDDTAIQFLPKWVCIAEGSKQLTINEVRDPKYYEAIGILDVNERRAAGYQIIRNLIKEGRLIVKDSNDGNSLSYTESLISYYKEIYPERNLVYILDNMHKVHEFGGNGDERIKFKSISETLKGFATHYHIPVLCTVEYTKLGAGIKPTNTNIAETVQIEYDSNFIAHLYNEAHERGEEYAESVGMTHNCSIHGKIKKLPIIELSIGKNKITDFKNKLFFNFYPSSSDFVACDTGEMEMLIESKKQEEKEKNVPYWKQKQTGTPLKF